MPSVPRLALATLLALATFGQGVPARAAEPARFVVGDRAVTAPLDPVTATIGRLGDTLMPGGGFEPVIYRTLVTAREDAPDRLIVSSEHASGYRTLREGALDGAEVQILRVVDGRMQVVREDRVAPGGHMVSGWNELLQGGKVIPGDAVSTVPFWPGWYRPDAPTWFRLRAVSPEGALSPPSEAVRLSSGRKGEPARPRRDDANDALEKFPERKRMDAAGAPSAPRGLRAEHDPDGAPRLVWTPPAQGRVGGYVLYVSSTPPEAERGYGFVLEGGAGKAPIREGDMAIVRQEYRQISRIRLHDDRIWGAFPAVSLRPDLLSDFPDETPGMTWILRDHAPGDGVREGGRSFLELRLDRGASLSLGRTNHAGADQSYYRVLEAGRPFRVEAWLRSDRPGIAEFAFAGSTEYRKTVRPIRFATGPQWRHVSAEFTLPKVLDKGVGRMNLTFEGPNVYGVDNLRVGLAVEAPFDLSARDYARLADSGVKTLRTHALVKTGTLTYDLASLTNTGGAINGVAGDTTLPQLLAMMTRAGVNPWLQIEPHLTDAEWLGLAEYLAAPAGAGPWADKRVAQGRFAPWTEAFDRIELELGNETWNRMMAPWIFPGMVDGDTGERLTPGVVYGLFQERIARLLKSSPWWTPEVDRKVRFVIGGWSINEYGEQAAAASPSTELMTIAAYNGGWDENEGPPDLTPLSYFNVLNTVTQKIEPRAIRHAAAVAAIGAARGTPLYAGTYEAGPGYAHPRIGKGKDMKARQEREQEQVMKSQAGGVATLDAVLAQARAGFRIQNIFTFSEGVRWTSHAYPRDGGQAYPHWKLLSLFNREGRGEMLDVRGENLPVADLKAAKGGNVETSDAPLVAAYATRAGDRVNLFVLSRRAPDYPVPGEDGCTPVEVALPFAHADRLTVHRMAGPHDAHNLVSDAVRIETETPAVPADLSRFALGPQTGAPACGLPPASVFLYVFEGVR